MLNPLLLLTAFLFTALLSNAPVQAAELTLPALPAPETLTAPTALGVRDGDAGLAPGTPVPDFSAWRHTGDPVSKADLFNGQKPVLVIFYRGGWCPYCNLQIRQLTEAYDEFSRRGVSLLLISADRPDAAALAQRQYEIPFPVLSDPQLNAHAAFKVAVQMTPELYQQYRQYGIDVEQWSGQKHHQFALSSAFLVAADGQVQWAHVSADYRQRPSVAQLLSAIDQQ